MRKTTLKELHKYVKMGIATNVSDMPYPDIYDFLKAHNFEKVAYSSGVYGLNGCLLQDHNTGDLFAVIGRSSNLLILW